MEDNLDNQWEETPNRMYNLGEENEEPEWYDDYRFLNEGFEEGYHDKYGMISSPGLLRGVWHLRGSPSWEMRRESLISLYLERPDLQYSRKQIERRYPWYEDMSLRELNGVAEDLVSDLTLLDLDTRGLNQRGRELRYVRSLINEYGKSESLGSSGSEYYGKIAGGHFEGITNEDLLGTLRWISMREYSGGERADQASGSRILAEYIRRTDPDYSEEQMDRLHPSYRKMSKEELKTKIDRVGTIILDYDLESEELNRRGRELRYLIGMNSEKSSTTVIAGRLLDSDRRQLRKFADWVRKNKIPLGAIFITVAGLVATTAALIRRQMRSASKSIKTTAEKISKASKKAGPVSGLIADVLAGVISLGAKVVEWSSSHLLISAGVVTLLVIQTLY